MEPESADFPRPLTEPPAPDQLPAIELHPAASPAASSLVPAAVFPAVSPAPSPPLPAASLEAALAAPGTSPQARPAPSPVATFQTVSQANEDVSSVPEASADLEEATGEAVTISGSSKCPNSVLSLSGFYNNLLHTASIPPLLTCNLI